MNKIKETALFMLNRWIDFVQHARLIIIIAALLLAGWAVHYIANNLGMNTSTKDMLSAELSWRKLDLEYERMFPQTTDNIIVVVEAATPDQAADATILLYRNLQNETTLFKSIYYPRALSNFKESALLYLDTGELQDLADNLAKIQPFLARLTEDQTLRGLFSMLADAIDAVEDGEDINIDPVLTQINAAITAVQQNRPYRVSWQQLMNGGETDKPIYREFIILQPILDYSDLFPAEIAINKLNELTKRPDIENIDVKVRLTGSVVMAHEQMLDVTRGTLVALILSLIMVAIILINGLRSLRLVFATLLTLIVGLIFTTAFATFTVGNLNLISVAFAVLYIGLGIAYAIHYSLRYQELIFDDFDNNVAINRTTQDVGSALFLCAITTASGFFAFVPTDYSGVAELGWISGFGMLISLIVTLSLLPALLSLMPLKRMEISKSNISGSISRKIWNFPFNHSSTIKTVSLLLVLISLILVVNLRFDHNTLNLQNQKNESVKMYKDLLADKDTSPWIGAVLTDSKEDALRTIQKFKALPVVKQVVWLEDFIPGEQDKKLPIIEELDLLLLGGMTEEISDNKFISAGEQYQVIKSFTEKLEQAKYVQENSAFLDLRKNLRTYINHLQQQDLQTREELLKNLSESILASLPGRLTSLSDSLNAGRITRNTLPRELSQRWLTSDSNYLLEIYPAENLNDNDAMRRFVEQLEQLDPRIIGAPVVNLKASDAVVKAFIQAFSYALITIVILLLIMLRKKRDIIYILTPLLMATMITGGICVLFNIPLNFANIIALPLLLGVGVDGGIHILHRYRTNLTDTNKLLATSSAKAVVLSALTIICSIGNLVFSPDAGAASMGQLLAIGTAATLVCILIVMPSLLVTQQPQQ